MSVYDRDILTTLHFARSSSEDVCESCGRGIYSGVEYLVRPAEPGRPEQRFCDRSCGKRFVRGAERKDARG